MPERIKKEFRDEVVFVLIPEDELNESKEIAGI